MKNAIIAIIAIVAVTGLVYYIYSGMKATITLASSISGDVITRYVNHLQEAEFDAAWHDCLSDSYKANVGLVDFMKGQAAHRSGFGPLQGWEELRYQHEANLFSSASLIGFNAVLHYEKRDVFVLYKVDTTVEPYRIVQIFGSSARSDSLSEGVW